MSAYKTGDLAMREWREALRLREDQSKEVPECVSCGDTLPYHVWANGDEICERCMSANDFEHEI